MCTSINVGLFQFRISWNLGFVTFDERFEGQYAMSMCHPTVIYLFLMIICNPGCLQTTHGIARVANRTNGWNGGYRPPLPSPQAADERATTALGANKGGCGRSSGFFMIFLKKTQRIDHWNPRASGIQATFGHTSHFVPIKFLSFLMKFKSPMNFRRVQVCDNRDSAEYLSNITSDELQGREYMQVSGAVQDTEPLNLGHVRSVGTVDGLWK